MVNFMSVDEIYIQEGTIDFRRSINGIAMYIQENHKLNPMSNSLFIFCNKHWNKLKILYWDKDGFWLMYKRLEKGKYDWIKKGETLKKITEKQLEWLLDGLPIEPKNYHEELKFTQL